MKTLLGFNNLTVVLFYWTLCLLSALPTALAADCPGGASISVIHVGGGMTPWTPGAYWAKWEDGSHDDGVQEYCVGEDVWLTYGGSACFGGGSGELTPNPGGTGGSWVQLDMGGGNTLYAITGVTKPGMFTVTYKHTVQCEGEGEQAYTVTAKFKFSGGDGESGCGCEGDGEENTERNAYRALGSGQSVNNGVDFSLGLGIDSNGNDAGSLYIRSRASGSSLSLPSLLGLDFVADGVERLPDSGTIQQVKTPHGLVVVETVNSYKYKLKVYYDSDVGGLSGGFYTYSGSPFVTWVIENPDTSMANNRLWITEQRSGQSDRINKYTYTSTYAQWDLLRPDEATLTQYRVPDGGDSTKTNEYNQVWFNSTLIQQTQNLWKYVAALTNVILLQRVEGDGTINQTTAYTYNSSNWVQRIDYPDGNWVYYKYDNVGRVTNEFRPFGLNSPPGAGTEPSVTTHLCKLFEYRYSLNSSEDGVDHDPEHAFALKRREIEFVPVLISGSYQRKEVSRLYRIADDIKVETRRAVTADDGWDSAELVSLDQFYNTEDFRFGRYKSKSHYNGTATIYSYSEDGSSVTAVETTGVVDSWTAPTEISSGVETISVRDSQDRIVSLTVKDFTETATNIISGYTNTWLSSDPFGRDYRHVGMDGRTNTLQYACCGLESVTDKEGVVTSYTYDVLNRKIAEFRAEGATGIEHENILDSLARVLVQQRIGTNGNVIAQEQFKYDILGRVTHITNALGGVTAKSHSIVSGRRREVTIFPDGGTRTNDFYRDGQLEKVSGTAVASIRYDSGAELQSSVARKYLKQIKLNDAYADSSEWIKTYEDMLGRPYRTAFADGAVALQQYNATGQKTADLDPDDVRTLYRYDTRGDLVVTAVDVDHDGYVDDYDAGHSGSDRITKRTTSYLANGAAGNSRGVNIRVDEELLWTTASSVTTALVRKTETATSTLKSWHTVYKDQSTPVTTTVETAYGSNGSRTITNTAPTNVRIVSAYSYGRLLSVTEKDSANAQVAKTDFNYDPHGRRLQSVDARNGAASFAYNSADQIVATTTPASGIGMSSQTTTTTHDLSMRATVILQPDGQTQTNEYSGMGLLKKTSGTRTYPVEYTYDSQGRMKTMKTWQDFIGNANTATTTWNYEANRGWLLNKRYNDNAGPDYTYTAGGRLHSRKWARAGTSGNPLLTTYTNSLSSGSWHGDLWEIRYSNSHQTTPNVTITYDRRGRKTQISSSNAALDYTYYDNDIEGTNSHGSGPLVGIVIARTYNDPMQITALAVNTPGSAVSQGFTYDNAGRLSTATDGDYNTTYSYEANSRLVSQILYKNNTTTRLTTTKKWDYLNHLSETKGVPSGSGELSSLFRYAYNDANQRISCTLGDGSYWVYQYDKLGQVISGDRFWGDGTPVAGQQYDYVFDDIGNRTSAKVGGDGGGQNLQSSTYSRNLLNQYSQRTVPAIASVLGIATAGATVTANDQSVYRRGEYFWKELGVTNSSASVWLSITNKAVNGGSSSTVTGNQYIPKSAEVFTYDTDGNLTADGRWNYYWDTENRLVQMIAATANGPQQRVIFYYDPLGRRLRKQVYNNTAGTGTPAVDIKFIYDGWNLVAELDTLSSNNRIRSYLWGTDMSGSREGAGGVGGLLAIKDSSGVAHFPVFDGNGNVMRLVAGDTGTTSATYEYGPFGETIRVSGSYASSNPMRFSTKYREAESELYYYGHRFYALSTGRWLSRDPITETGGANVYAFCQNSSTLSIDPDGRFQIWLMCREPCRQTYSCTSTVAPIPATKIIWTPLGNISVPILGFHCIYKCDFLYDNGSCYDEPRRGAWVPPLQWNLTPSCPPITYERILPPSHPPSET